MKIAFFDFDNVLLLHKGPNAVPKYPVMLNSHDDLKGLYKYYSTLFDKDHMGRVKKLTDLGVKIIIHSSWRDHHNLEELKSLMSIYGIDQDNVIDVCADYFQAPKPRAIREMIVKYNPEKYVVIDDENFYLNEAVIIPEFLKIDPENGFDEDAYNKSLVLLDIE